jgi:hypothetical protein
VTGPAGAILTVGAEFTLTETAVEFTVAPVLSVTCRMKLQLPVAVELEVAKLKLSAFEPAVT